MTDDPLAQPKADLAGGSSLKATERLTKFLQENPGSIHVDEANYLLGLAYLDQKDRVLAADYFQKVTRDFPQSPLAPESSYYLALSYDQLSRPSSLDQDWTERAIGSYRLFLAKYPQHARVPEVEARIHTLEDRLAQKLFDNGALYLRMGRPTSAEVYFQRVIEQYSQSSDSCKAATGLGQTYMKRRRWQEAVTQFEQVVDSCPDTDAAKKGAISSRSPAPRSAAWPPSRPRPRSTRPGHRIPPRRPRRGEEASAMTIGVFGGTFDPIHWGHLVLAEEAMNAAGLDRILFVPSALPPHKQGRELTAWTHRMAMVRLAVDGIPGFEVSDIESDPGRPHYSLDTLERLAERHAGDRLSFIIGSDSLLEMPGWRSPATIVERWPLVVLARPGFDAATAPPSYTTNMTLVDGVQVTVSSTLVRRRLASGGKVRFLVPDGVIEYARRNGLYGMSA